VKPRSEAASFGLRFVERAVDLQKAVHGVLDEFKQPVLVEEFIEGREVNVSLLGNNPPEVLPVLELMLQEAERKTYDREVKFSHGNGQIRRVCPASLPEETAAQIRDVSVRAFEALNICDYGRVDIRLDRQLRPYILEMNSMASINPTSSFVEAARVTGYTYTRLMNRILEVAVERYAAEQPEFFRVPAKSPV
jgi:D-alanine-D-alanine ligase